MTKLLRIPKKLRTIEELLGTIRQLEGVENIVALVNDEAGVWIMTLDDTTYERVNWMIDRAKRMLHRDEP